MKAILRLTALLIAGLCASGAVLAQLEAETPTRQAMDIVLVLDNTATIRTYDPDVVSKRAIAELAQKLDTDTRIGIVFFDAEAREAWPLRLLGPEAVEALGETLEALNYRGQHTNISAAMERAIYALKREGRPEASKSIVLLTDGIMDTGDRTRDLENGRWLREELSADAALHGIAVFSVAIGKTADFLLLHAIAQKTGGDNFRVEQVEDIAAVLERVQAAIVQRATLPPVSEGRVPASPPELQETPEVPAQTPEATAAPTPQAEPAPPPVLPAAPPIANDGRGDRLSAWLLGISALLGALAFVAMRILAWVKKTARSGAAMRGPVPDELPEAFLHDLSGITGFRQHRLTKPMTFIGRIVIDLPSAGVDQFAIEKATVGRRHAFIEYRQHGFWITDHDSVNGTFVNGQRIKKEAYLKHGDRIRFGDCEFKFEIPAMATADQTSLLPGTLRDAIARQERRATQHASEKGSEAASAVPLDGLELGDVSADRLPLRAMAGPQEDEHWPMPTEKVCSAPPTPQFDVSDVVTLRQRISRAATSLKVIGFFSALMLFFFLSDYFFVAALVCTLLVPGFASSAAKQLRSGSTRAAAVAAGWCLLWFSLCAFVAFPKSLKAGVSGYGVLGWLMFLVPLFFLAWGLFAFTRYRAHKPTGGNNADLLAHPWEEGLRIKTRPRFVSKKSIAAYAFLILSPLPYLWLWASQFTHDVRSFSDIWEQAGYITAVSLVAFGALYWGVRIYRRARRAAMLPGSTLVKKDVRAIVLYLRSFHDDSGIKLRARAANGRILPELLVKASFEEVVCDHLWRYGPVLAIGDPQTKGKTAPLGAARDYAMDSSWQEQVTGLMRQASMIVAVAGQTKGLVWELDRIVSSGFISKFVLLIPPVNWRELDARWLFLASNVPSLNLSPEIDLGRARGVIFPEGHAALVCGDKRNDWTYEAVLDQAALTILSGAGDLGLVPSALQSHTGRFFNKIGHELAVFVKSALVMVGIGLAFMVAYSANQLHYTSSRPYTRPSKDRDAFVTELIEGCKGENAGISEDALVKYCTCVANGRADTVTYGELEAVTDSKSSIFATARDLQASFHEKAKAAARACSKEAFGQ